MKQCLHANMKQITEISRKYQLNISEISNCSKCGRKISEKCHTVTTVGGGISKISEIPVKYQKYHTVATVGVGISKMSEIPGKYQKYHTIATVGGGISKISEILGKYQKYHTIATVGGGI